MIVGLLGAHRTGKTTLAKATAEASGIRFMQVQLSEAQRILGFDSSKQDYAFKERRQIQEGLLNYMAELLAASANGNVIYDRTPLDLIGYTVSLANSNVLDHDDELWLQKFIADCHALTNHYFHKVFLVQPGIPLEYSPKSAAPQPGYVNHLNYIYLGVVYELNMRTTAYVIPVWITDLDQRINFILKNSGVY